MRSSRRLLTLALLAAAARGASADGREEAQRFEALLAQLGTPTEAAAVRALTQRPEMLDAGPALRLVTKLRHAGGVEAARGLRALVRHRDPRVRALALEGIASAGLRVPDGIDAVRLCVQDWDPAVRAAACAALGRVGDAEDVPALLALLSSSDRSMVKAAYGALAELTGVHLPYEPRVWRDWWTEVYSVTPRRIRNAVTVLEAGGDPRDLADASRLLARHGWMCRADMEAAVHVWLNSWDWRLRDEARRIVSNLRLGAFVGDLRLASPDSPESPAPPGRWTPPPVRPPVEGAPDLRIPSSASPPATPRLPAPRFEPLLPQLLRSLAYLAILPLLGLILLAAFAWKRRRGATALGRAVDERRRQDAAAAARADRDRAD